MRPFSKNSHPNIGYLYYYKYKVATLVKSFVVFCSPKQEPHLNPAIG
jgi:hypothetical protein